MAGRISKAELDGSLDQVAAFEHALADDGTVIVKFWMHLSKAAQKKRLQSFERDPLQRWRVTKEQWKHWRMFDKFVATADHAIRRTSTDHAPWHIVEGADEEYRAIVVGSALRDAIRRGLARARTAQRQARTVAKTHQTRPDPIERVERRFNVLDNLDLTQRLSDRRFKVKLAEQQSRLSLLQRQARRDGVSTVVVFEGWDAAGKGGAIRRVTAALDARDYDVIPTAAPTDEERARHHLWRFWRHLSRAGRMIIFDRS